MAVVESGLVEVETSATEVEVAWPRSATSPTSSPSRDRHPAPSLDDHGWRVGQDVEPVESLRELLARRRWFSGHVARVAVR